MLDDMKMVTFSTMCRGAIEERFQDALEEILNDITDINTDVAKIRRINISISLKPNKERTRIDYMVDMAVKMPNKPLLGSSIFIYNDKGRPVAMEHSPAELPFDDEKIINIGRKD